MKVVAGKYKRSNLFTLDGDDITRPTKDIVKQAIFSSIDVYQKNFLDLFSGSGAMGIEALSRDANEVIFNDINFMAYKIIKKNLEKFNENRLVYNLDYISFLNQNKLVFDYIFIDPPYKFYEFENLFNLIENNSTLSLNGLIIIETHKSSILKETYNKFKLFKQKTFGITKISYYKYEV